jgi:tyrosyl-tRNA synthetase
MDLIRRLRAGKAHGLVMPLITTASGTKFGKTETGTIWLDPVLTTPFQFYQFWLQTEDRDVVRYLKFFTFLDAPAIAELEKSLAEAPEARTAQRALARDVTRRVHGEDALADAEAAAHALFAERISSLTARQVEQALVGVPSATVARAEEGWPIVDLLAISGVTKSKSEATRLIRGGGLSVNDQRVMDEKARVTAEQAIEGWLFVLRKGKRDYFLVRIQ